jgi:hypothetical protein
MAVGSEIANETGEADALVQVLSLELHQGISFKGRDILTRRQMCFARSAMSA